MKISCGTDIIEIKRIKESIERTGQKFLDTIYTKKEVDYCESKKNQKYQHYAARFAAKEAVFKALSDNIATDAIRIVTPIYNPINTINKLILTTAAFNSIFVTAYNKSV